MGDWQVSARLIVPPLPPRRQSEDLEAENTPRNLSRFSLRIPRLILPFIHLAVRNSISKFETIRKYVSNPKALLLEP